MAVMLSPPQFAAVIPAAGFSRRMGRPKLLLPWGNSTIIETLVDALHRADITSIVIVFRKSDLALESVVRRLNVTCVQPELDPPDMRSSVEHGLSHLAQHWNQPGGWFLIPADHPLVATETIQQLTSAIGKDGPEILIPTWQNHRGHPTLFSWNLAPAVAGIPEDRGVNWLVQANQHVVREIPVSDPGITADLDTPEDYERFRV
jgi:molybdenum cofactor cytidylyltransferase